MKLRLLALLLLAGPAAADPAGVRLSDLFEMGPKARKDLLNALRLAKERDSANGEVSLFEALIAYADGRALEASDYASQAAAAKRIDFGDRERAIEAVERGSEAPLHPGRVRACAELGEFLLAWGEEWEWRGKDKPARHAYSATAGLAELLLEGATDFDQALVWANLKYRARHPLVGLALRGGDEKAFESETALANEAHTQRTVIAATAAPSTREEKLALVRTGPLALICASVEPPDHPVLALAEAPKIFSGKTPGALLVAALEDRFDARSLPLRWDAALALRPHAGAIADSLRKWTASAERPWVGSALLAVAGERIEVPEEALEDPWAARACSDENALERAFERLPKLRRVPVAFRLKDLRREDEIDLGR